jgi:hypothetical protein
MAPGSFDDLVFALGAASSRRSLLRLLGAGMAAALAQMGRPHGAAAACKADGSKCQRSEQCCSGACKGKRRKGKCRATPEARGCQTDDPYATPCPERTNDSQFCWVTLGGKPFCGTSLQCFNCATNDACVQEFGNATARCVKVGAEAGCALYNHRSCVVYP